MSKTKLAVLLLLVLLALEGAARIYVWQQGLLHRELVFDFSRGTYMPHPEIGFVLRPGVTTRIGRLGKKMTVNSLGFRGPELHPQTRPRRIRVACIGASTTMGTKVDDLETYPRLLEGHLRAAYPGVGIDVINAGVGGYTTPESLRNLQLRVLPLDPEIVVILHAGTDVKVRTYAEFRDDYSHYRRVFVPPEKSRIDSLLDHVYSYAVPRYLLIRPDMHLYNFTTWAANRPATRAEENENFRKSSTLPFQRNLAAMVDVSARDGSDVVLSTLPYSQALLRRNSGLPVLAYRKGIAADNQIVRQLARQKGALLVDLASEFPSADASLFVGPLHLNKHGSAIKARIIADTIIAADLIGRRVPDRSKGESPEAEDSAHSP